MYTCTSMNDCITACESDEVQLELYNDIHVYNIICMGFNLSALQSGLVSCL